MTTSQRPAPHPRTRFYYGWVIVGVAIVAGGFAPGISIWGAGVFMPAMIDAFGWSSKEFLFALTVRSLVSAAFAPWIGPILDKPGGPRRLMMVSVLALGLSLIALRYISDDLVPIGFVDARVQFYVLFGFVGGAAQMGAGQALAQTVLPKWFIQRRGRVLGIAATGTAMGALVFPPLIQTIIDVAGFQWAWMVLGILMIGVLFPLSFLVHTQPEDLGMTPDGGSGEPSPGAATRVDVERSLTRREAARTPTFWFLIAAFSVTSLGLVGYHSNWHNYFTGSQGFAATTAVYAVSFYAVFAMIARFTWGSLADRFHPKNLMVAGTFLTGASIVYMQTVNTTPELLAFGVFHGLSIGSYFVLQPLLLARYFGRAHLGSIFGVVRPAMTLTGAGSPLLVGALFDSQGDYKLAFAIVAACWIVASVLLLVTVAPKRIREAAVQSELAG